MKIFKYLTLLFLLFLLAFVVFVATQPATYQITKQKEINSPSAIVFDYVTDFSNWSDWQQFNKDEDLNFTTSANTIGEKAFVIWNTKNKIATTFAQNDSIVQDYIQGTNKQTLHWKFNKTKTGTLALVTIKGDLTFKEKIYSVLNGGITSYVGPQIEKSLQKINNFLVDEIGTFDIKVQGLVNRPETVFIEQKDSCLVKDFPKKSKSLLKTMKTFIKNNAIETLGEPFVIFYNSPNGNMMKYSMCVPVKDEILTTPESDIQGNSFESFLAVKTVLKGDYSHMKKAWSKARNYIAENKFSEDKSLIYMGIYKKSLPEVSEPSKWETEIYIPIVKKKTAPKRKIVKDSTSIISTPTNTETTE
jgi:nucleoside-triphosphatase THEP1